MKRFIDIIASLFGLLVTLPITLIFIVLIWLQDFHSPFYIAPRVAKGNKSFKMVKLRSMVVNADKSGVDSTSANDKRITWVGHLIRKFKLDELSQLWNVLIGDMSLVGPRPNVRRDVDLYTKRELELLSVRPGITDISSIVFSDEGDILAGAHDPDLKYNQVIRPWKSRLGLLYIENQSVLLDLKLIAWTVLAILSKDTALRRIESLLLKLNASPELRKAAKRDSELLPYPPPGSNEIVTKR
ncbi:sugar transferase [Pelagicoccus enzymogenes]|uniref:sugar transferase n=1 Tax=Pelagicoccus enzymogenes TaxID=2773457 RepID=UPI00280E468F|nr:sugar transferase [Pelagicoccus enzymogenes]MDQ8199789.1 sugar transferase [Pelagicoccus enzymogenes]